MKNLKLSSKRQYLLSKQETYPEKEKYCSFVENRYGALMMDRIKEEKECSVYSSLYKDMTKWYSEESTLQAKRLFLTCQNESILSLYSNTKSLFKVSLKRYQARVSLNLLQLCKDEISLPPEKPEKFKAIKVEEDVSGVEDKIKIEINLDALNPDSLHIFKFKDKEVGVQILPKGRIKFFEVIEE